MILSALLSKNSEGLIYNKYRKLAEKIFVVAILLGIGATATVWAQPQAGEPSTSLLNATRAIALNAKTGKVYAARSRARCGRQCLVAEKAATISVKVGKDPVALAINETTNRIYVANNGGGSVSVIDGSNDAVVATVNVGALPYVLAVNPVTNKIFVSNTFSDKITLIDGATNAMSTVESGIGRLHRDRHETGSRLPDRMGRHESDRAGQQARDRRQNKNGRDASVGHGCR